MYKWKVYNQSDVAEAFEYFGYTVDMYEEKPVNSNSITGYKEHDMKEISDVISEYDIVFSLNYFRIYQMYVKSLERSILHGQ